MVKIALRILPCSSRVQPVAVHPRTLRPRTGASDLHVSEPGYQLISDDLKLFATTFAAGFLFVSVLIG